MVFVSTFCNKAKDDKDKAKLSLKGLKAQKKRKPPDTSGMLEAGNYTLSTVLKTFSVKKRLLKVIIH